MDLGAVVTRTASSSTMSKSPMTPSQIDATPSNPNRTVFNAASPTACTTRWNDGSAAVARCGVRAGCSTNKSSDGSSCQHLPGRHWIWQTLQHECSEITTFEQTINLAAGHGIKPPAWVPPRGFVCQPASYFSDICASLQPVPLRSEADLSCPKEPERQLGRSVERIASTTFGGLYTPPFASQWPTSR